MDRFDPFVKYADVYGDIINWEKDPMNKPQNQNKYFFSDGKTYYEQICKMLRLMSVFKEAFNQIYSNEDEISEAWENFVNNLSASVVKGSEPDVTLTWTDDSVNFEFTMVPGVPGEQGVGITSISFNSDYTMTITLSDGNTYTSMALKGETGPQGPQGKTGSGLQILDVYATLADLQSAHPTGQPGDAYQVGSEGNYTLYIWSSSQSAWVPAGSLGTVSPSVSNPLMDGTASAGSSDLYSRGDHVHPSDTSRASKEELDALIKTSQSLIDQSFTYRESPAIQDGLARIDKIKGNTLVWNQLVQNGNFADSSGWTSGSGDFNITIDNNIATLEVVTPRNSAILQGNVLGAKQNHFYYATADLKYDVAPGSSDANKIFIGSGEYDGILKNVTQSNTWVTVSGFFKRNTGGSDAFRLYPRTGGMSAGDKIYVRNVMIVDLTAIFGADKSLQLWQMEQTTEGSVVAYFRSLFPLSYYSYNQGSQLSFNGNGIKTVGFNQWDEEWELGSISNVGVNMESTTEIRSKNYIRVQPNKEYYLHASVASTFNYRFYDADKRFISSGYIGRNNTLLIPNGVAYMRFYMGSAYGTNYNHDICININDPSKNGTYEPYTSSTLSLPISTYFPTGMKSAGNVYDELTPRKAITRIGAVDLGSLTWNKTSGTTSEYDFFETSSVTPIPAPGGTLNVLCPLYKTVNSMTSSSGENKAVRITGLSTIRIRNLSYTDATAFKTAMNGVYLYFELATPTETSISLEHDLSFKAYLNGTEQLLPVNGSVPSTSPIISDMTYLSIDDTMEYIIDKLANVPQNTQQILESLEDDVADLQTDVSALQPAVSALQTSVGNINTNIGQISSTVAGHTSSISDMQSDITDLNTSLSDLEDTVTDNTSRIGTLETGLSATNGNVQNLETSVSDLDDTVTAQGTTVTDLDSIIQDISNNPVAGALGSHELGFVAAYVSATLPANTGTKVTIPKPVIFPNNYTPLFIVGMDTGSYNVSICSIPNTFGNRDSVDCRVWNHGGQQTTQITVYILCMRQRQSQ